jgi:hypothetical protein
MRLLPELLRPIIEGGDHRRLWNASKALLRGAGRTEQVFTVSLLRARPKQNGVRSATFCRARFRLPPNFPFSETLPTVRDAKHKQASLNPATILSGTGGQPWQQQSERATMLLK